MCKNIGQDIKKYGLYVLCAVGLFFGLGLTVLATNIVTQTVGAVVATGAVVSGVFTLIRDGMQRHHENRMQEQDQVFSLGAMSHMANVTFDHHVEFCEEYLGAIAEIVPSLWREGPSKECLSHSSKLTGIRTKHNLWINDQINEPLVQLEGALWEIGCKEGLLESIPVSEKRSEIVTLVYDLFSEILQIKNDNKKSDEEKEQESQIATSKILNHLRKLLEVEDLTKIRKTLVRRAVKCSE